MNKYLGIFLIMAFNMSFPDHTTTYLDFYFKTRNYSAVEAIYVEDAEVVYDKTTRCKATYGFSADGKVFKSSNVVPWQKAKSPARWNGGWAVTDQDLGCEFSSKLGNIVIYDTKNPQNAFLYADIPLFPMIWHVSGLLVLLYFLRLKS